jgi:HPt (histidine-containing phosphotransfer) domain-containing protein
MVTAYTSTPVFNHSQLLVNLGGDLELAAELAELYQIEGIQLLNQIKLAIERKDLEATSRLSHSLKGASANVAASQLLQCSLALETAAHQGDWQTIRDCWKPLPELFYTFSNHVAGIFSLPLMPTTLQAFMQEYAL